MRQRWVCIALVVSVLLSGLSAAWNDDEEEEEEEERFGEDAHLLYERVQKMLARLEKQKNESEFLNVSIFIGRLWRSRISGVRIGE